MIVHLTPAATETQAAQISEQIRALYFWDGDRFVLVTGAKDNSLEGIDDRLIESTWVMDSDIQLASRKYMPETRTVQIDSNLAIGGKTGNTMMITGPCSVESLEQIEVCAQLCVELGVKMLRAGAYKPRTSPYSFQGMGIEGLRLLDKMREKYGLKVITEVRDATHVEDVIAFADVIQIGAKAMYDQGILRRCATAGKPVLLKRGFGSTLQEFVQAAEFLLSGGNSNVVLCERGIRTFETKTRFTLDLCGVAYLKEYTNLPVILDPSHAMGYAYGVADLARACTAMGVDGLLIESHPNPKVAKSDASQQLDHPQFRALMQSLHPIAAAVGRQMI
ncbi:MAG: 3-deoxy-7-phosphoheptulonate synthase [Bacteroidetes bacterium]|nr:3-deoxy-7-phosphoheptulonate synthase [Bacteroidota bacterium]